MPVSQLKKVFLIVLAIGIIYYLINYTSILINRTDSFEKWAKRFYRIESGEDYDPPGLISIEDKEKVKKDFIAILKQKRGDLLFGAGSNALNALQSDRLVWDSDESLYLTDLSHFLGLPNEFEYKRWQRGIANYFSHSKNEDIDEVVFYAFAALNYQRVVFVSTQASDINIKDLVIDVKTLK